MRFDLTAHSLIPVATLTNIDDGLWLCDVLLDAGIDIIEVTNRSEQAFDVAKALIEQRPHMHVGMGTITNQDELSKAIDIGAKFSVSPGLLSFLPQQADIYQHCFMPGIQTVSEAMKARALGIKHLKVFPAEICGGAAFIKALQTVLPDMSFCPSGGVTIKNMDSYLAVLGVKQIASSELANPSLVKTRDKFTLIDSINAYKQKVTTTSVA